VFAVPTSSPDSTIVVHTSTSLSPRTNADITSSRSGADIWPWATVTRASGTSDAMPDANS